MTESVESSSVAASFADARSIEASSSSADRNSDRGSMAAIDDRSRPSIDSRSASFETRDNVTPPPDAPSVSTQPSATMVDDGTSAVTPAPIGTLAILAPAAQLPTAFAELLAPQARSLIASASLTSSTPAAAPATNVGEGQRQSVAPKILTIELEPAALGAVTVKMKLAHSGIDMRISVESSEALRRLDSTREKLVEAMQSSGCTIDSCTIQIGPTAADGANAQAAPDNGGGFAQAGGGGREEQSVGRQGAGYGGSGGDRRQGASAENGERGTNGEPRRVADRRGGDVYL
ncbi:flagellar hook-length control protein FliK [Methylosinus sp. LW4]|uniref:flagellar hook-length control protein FliK n=1 Tax=Methylosinus sp. LW4 TaxID=136993 RepID=UPI0003A70B75|nr:flagellar hook-length control protein FliK [Methylosinus sp. LW4]